jgi:hypothetical protein
MDVALEALVRQRARERCEYGRFPEAFAEVPFQIDPAVARQHCADHARQPFDR